VRPDLLEIAEPTHRRGRVQAFAGQHEQLFAALSQGQADVVSGLLTTIYVNGVSVADICDGPIRHAMHRIGEMWPDDKRGILVEHRATSICVDALHALRSRIPKPASKNAAALGGAPANDPYILPSLMSAAVLADVGMRPVNLGPSTPFEVLWQSALEQDAALIWIAMTSPRPRSEVEPALAILSRRVARGHVQVVIGGQAARRYKIPDASHVHRFESMSEMAGFAKGLVAARRRGK
jgi:methanogenic corrinoid protein MtbC1